MVERDGKTNRTINNVYLDRITSFTYTMFNASAFSLTRKLNNRQNNSITHSSTMNDKYGCLLTQLFLTGEKGKDCTENFFYNFTGKKQNDKGDFFNRPKQGVLFLQPALILFKETSRAGRKT